MDLEVKIGVQESLNRLHKAGKLEKPYLLGMMYEWGSNYIRVQSPEFFQGREDAVPHLEDPLTVWGLEVLLQEATKDPTIHIYAVRQWEGDITWGIRSLKRFSIESNPIHDALDRACLRLASTKVGIWAAALEEISQT